MRAHIGRSKPHKPRLRRVKIDQIDRTRFELFHRQHRRFYAFSRKDPSHALCAGVVSAVIDGNRGQPSVFGAPDGIRTSS